MTLTVPPAADERVVVATEADVSEALRDARARRVPLRIVAGGTWLDAGRPVASQAHLDVSSLSGITAYVPGDLTLTARASTTLADIAEATRVHGQWLPLDPFAQSGATLGATLATASAGPLAASIGVPRDLALGIAFVTGEGSLVRAGGRVVKNVAGFDLVRLTVGAWGTLGVITEATVRLRSLPERDVTLALPVPEDETGVARISGAIGAQLSPLAAELVTPNLAGALGLAPQPTLLLRIAGNSATVQAQRATVAQLGSAGETPSSIWTRLAEAEPSGALVMRVSRRPTELPRLWSRLSSVAERAGGAAHANVPRGIVRLWLPQASSALPDLLARLDSSDVRIFERLSPASWATMAPSRVNDALSRSVRNAFDPDRILNPGILGDTGA